MQHQSHIDRTVQFVRAGVHPIESSPGKDWKYVISLAFKVLIGADVIVVRFHSAVADIQQDGPSSAELA